MPSKILLNAPQTIITKQASKDMIPNTFCSKYLVNKFRQEAEQKRWSFTTLMNEILKERYGKGNNNNEDD